MAIGTFNFAIPKAKAVVTTYPAYNSGVPTFITEMNTGVKIQFDEVGTNSITTQWGPYYVATAISGFPVGITIANLKIFPLANYIGATYPGLYISFSNFPTGYQFPIGTRLSITFSGGSSVGGSFSSFNWPSYTYAWTVNANVNSQTWAAVDGFDPNLKVTITGVTSLAVGKTGTYTATVSGGYTPYTAQWTYHGRSGVASRGPVFNMIGNTSAGPFTFTKVDLMTLIILVTDSTGATATNTLAINIGSYAPNYMAQLMVTASGSQVDFFIYLTASDNGADPYDPGTMPVENTDNYSINLLSTGKEWSYYIIDDTPYTTPYIIMALYTDPTTGLTYTYKFTFDTTNFGAAGTWAKSNGVCGAGAQPSWWLAAKGLFSEGFRAVFVPTKDQMDQLLPTGVFASELNIFKDFNWGEKASGVYHMTVHFPKAHPNESQSWTITILTIDFDALSSAAFITVIRTAIQAMIGLILVFILIMSFVG